MPLHVIPETPVPATDITEVLAPDFRGFVPNNAWLETLATGFRWLEGPVWMGDWNCLLFQDLPNDCTMRWLPDGSLSEFRKPSRFGNGQTRDAQGRLVACSHRDRCLYVTDQDGTVRRLVDRHDGLRLNAPNDVARQPDGAIWFTDPLYGIQSDYEGGRQTSEQPPALYRLAPGASSPEAMARDFAGPNGLAFSPDGKRLYVAETGDQTKPDPEQFIRVFEVGDNGQLSGGEVFHKIAPGYCDGMTVDDGGCLWSSAADGVHCINFGGDLIGKIVLPRRVANLCFGGADWNRLFICASDRLLAIHTNRRGIST
ncbi:MAG: SMP-30/gluconolactonase/LRE family protein [Paracoccus sp. (in: a-proteobacteria)]